MALSRACEDSLEEGVGMISNQVGRLCIGLVLVLGSFSLGCAVKDSGETTIHSQPSKISDDTVEIKSITRANHNGSNWGTIYTIEHDGHAV